MPRSCKFAQFVLVLTGRNIVLYMTKNDFASEKKAQPIVIPIHYQFAQYHGLFHWCLTWQPGNGCWTPSCSRLGACPLKLHSGYADERCCVPCQAMHHYTSMVADQHVATCIYIYTCSMYIYICVCNLI